MTRIIGRLDVKGRRLIKGIQYEGVRVIGDALDYARKYYAAGIDELVYIDAVASLYGRPSMSQLLKDTVEEVFVPVTAGGGVNTVDDVRLLLSSGADKVAINTGAIRNPSLISEIADRFGSQCVVISIQAKQTATDKWEAYVECGREKTGIDVIEWAKEVEKLGAGEILLTAIDKDGTYRGGDIPLVQQVAGFANIPVIASGGIGSVEDVSDLIDSGYADALAIGKALHFERLDMASIRQAVKNTKRGE
ncbi:MAG: imidazole glycerol phosphate synthase subunit HisF [Gammaproteobacteria bacterium]|nr:imidazole glycerol phosphate synthase subunit HisF [Gammaproteobacteria bacterium]